MNLLQELWKTIILGFFKIQDKGACLQKRSKFESPERVVLYNCSGLVDMQILKEGKEQILLLM